MGLSPFWKGWISAFDLFGVWNDPREPLIKPKESEESEGSRHLTEDGFQQDADALRGDWEKIVGKW